MRDFWRSAGLHLVEIDPEGWLTTTPQLLLAYFTRPEIHPIETSCAEEVRLHEELLADPFRPVEETRLARLQDPDAASNYRAVLALRDLLTSAGTIEGAYLKLARASNVALPPVFIDQMVHLILRNVLRDARDPMRLRAGEIFFREQTVSTEGGRLLLADEEIVAMHAMSGETGLAQLLAESGTPMRSVELDVLDEDNKAVYWERSDRFDTVVDLRFEQPALDAFARVIEAWLHHLMRLDVRVEPRPRIEDRDWRWHIGLDREATHILNALYEGKTVGLDEMSRIVALFRMHIRDERAVIDRVKGRPVYLGLAMSPAKRVKMKPQNLLANLPLRPAA
ncbi:MAG: hypothetical protein KJZ80_03225 [Hyphomicrobiaceae bacterium]|nr:hypothetical protein [Hyphomicrobiaceae bacterium]